MSEPSEPQPVPPPTSPEILHPEIYAELRALAARRMAGQPAGHTLQPTVLVHEAWLRLAGREQGWRDRGHFFAAAATTMRHILIDHARRKARLRRGGNPLRVLTGTIADLPAPAREENVLRIDEAITTLEQANPERAQVVVARFFGGLTTPEIAESLGIGERSVERHWASAKVWLLRRLREDAP